MTTKYFFTIFLTVFLSSLVYSRAYGQDDSWQYVSMNKVMNNDGIHHYKWKMERPPYGPWDKISLHRLVYKGWRLWDWPNENEVIFIIPGTWEKSSASTDENTYTNLFLANRGYDVFTLDFRTSAIPPREYNQFDDLSSTAGWTYGIFREDIKACIEKVKQLTGADKIFLAGRSRGATQAYIYASKYWETDLKGLILLDGAGVTAGNGNPEMQIPEIYWPGYMAQFSAGLLPPPLDMLLSEVQDYNNIQLAGAVPTATLMAGADSLPDAAVLFPPVMDGSEIETISDYVAYGAFWAWGTGGLTNYYTPYPGGDGETYIDQKILVDMVANFTRYWPAIQDLEGSQLEAYPEGTCPFLDYDDNISAVTLPIIFFGGEFACPGGVCTTLPANKTASTDVTVKYLPGFGHLDVFGGTHSLEEVKQPLFDWMEARK